MRPAVVAVRCHTASEHRRPDEEVMVLASLSGYQFERSTVAEWSVRHCKATHEPTDLRRGLRVIGLASRKLRAEEAPDSFEGGMDTKDLQVSQPLVHHSAFCMTRSHLE